MERRALLSAFRDYLAPLTVYPEVAGFLQGFDWNLPSRQLDLENIPVVKHVQSINATPDDGLLGMLSPHAHRFHWGRTYGLADVGEHFLDNYGWMELFGSRGHFASSEMAGGFLVLGPGTDYPDHHHVADEIYVPLTEKSLWSKDRGIFTIRRAGEIIHHPSGMNHAMKTTDLPLLALYVWRGGSLTEKPKFQEDAQ